MSQVLEQKLATAIAAATEFKLMLDMQRPGSLFYPGRNRIDPRQSASYEKAAQDLFDLTFQEDDRGKRPTNVLNGSMAVGNVVANSGGEVPPSTLDVLRDIRVALAKLGIQVLSDDCDGTKDRSLFVFGFGSLSSLKKVTELADGENGIVHKTS